MKNNLILCACLVCGLMLHALAKAQSEWTLKKTAGDIRVFVREQPGTPIKELMIEATLRGRLSSVAALLNDPSTYPLWVYRTSASRLVERRSPFLMIYYARTDFPWPLSDRDLYAISEMRQDPGTGILVSESRLWSEGPPDPCCVRLPFYYSRWQFTPLGNGLIELRYQLRSDPGGWLPAWLINMAIEVGPVATIERLREMVQRDPWRKARMPHIVKVE